MRRASLLLAAALAAAPALADDWLQSATDASEQAVIYDEPLPAKPAAAYVPYEGPLLRSELPNRGWRAFEDEDALGSVLRVLGPDAPSGGTRAVLSVRLFDRSTPGFVPARQAADAMRRDAPGRDSTPVRAMRVAAGLARIFEVTQIRRETPDEGPALPETIHEYVAIVPRGESYYVVRLVSARDAYLETRDVFAHFLKQLRPVGAR